MGNFFIWADPHLGHKNCIRLCHRKPWLIPNPDFNPLDVEHFGLNNKYISDIQKHDSDLINNHNSLVKKGDMVIILGDFAWRDHGKYLAQLKGNHILVTGNHDKMPNDVLRCFTEVHEMGCRKRILGWDITFCHYAMRSWASSCHNSVNFHGHSHGRMPEFKNMLACDGGVDIWGYGVMPLEAGLKKMQMKIDWTKENKLNIVDGEYRADGEFDKDPNQRVLDIRLENKEIMRSLGYSIDETMWLTE